MTTTSPPDDALDSLLSDFFKGQMKQPWPAAPNAGQGGNEPSTLAAARAAQVPGAEPRNQPAAASRDTGNRSRYTLAASVAILLGTCWTLSNGFRPGERSGGVAPPPAPGIDLRPATADGKDTLPGELKKEADRGNDINFVPPKIDLP